MSDETPSKDTERVQQAAIKALAVGVVIVILCVTAAILMLTVALARVLFG